MREVLSVFTFGIGSVVLRGVRYRLPVRDVPLLARLRDNGRH
jgi:hypothetical protein